MFKFNFIKHNVNIIANIIAQNIAFVFLFILILDIISCEFGHIKTIIKDNVKIKIIDEYVVLLKTKSK